MVMLSDAGPAPRKTPRFPSRERHYAVRRKARDAVTSPKQLTPRREEEAAERRLEAEKEQQVDQGGSCSSSDGGASECGCGDCRYWQLWCCDECSRRCDQVAASARDRHKKTCSSCKCPRDAHDVYHEEWVNVRERLGFKPDRLEPRDRSVSDGYCWVPPGLHSTQQIEKYFSELPPEKVPEMGSVGEKYRDKQLVQQLPKQDLALAYCKHVETQHHASYEDFISARNEIALDIGYVREAGAYTLAHCQSRLMPVACGYLRARMQSPKCSSKP